MNFTHEEKQRAFATYRNLFSGQNGLVKKGKKIKEILVAHHFNIGQPLSDREISRLVVLIQSLVPKKVFRSTTRAMELFPAMFMPTVPRSEAREASEVSASRKESEMLDAVDSATEREDDCAAQRLNNSLEDDFDTSEGPSEVAQSLGNGTSSSKWRKENDLMLFPTYFPYETQHLLLGGVQDVLEQCCFEFISRWLPEEIQKRGWTTPSAVELTKWTRLLPKWQKSIPLEASVMESEWDLEQTCLQVNKIRHAAVHRLPLTANTLQSQLAAAVSMTAILKDEVRTEALQHIKRNLERHIQELEREKTLIEYAFDQDLEAIRRQRKKLDEAEQELFRSASQRDCTSKAEVGKELCASTRQVLNGLRSATQISESGSDHVASETNMMSYLLMSLEAFGIKVL